MNKGYYTYRIRIANVERVQVEKWDAQHKLLGEPSGVFRYQDNLEEIKSLINTARNDEIKNSKQARLIGEVLFNSLFDDTLRQDFVNFHFQVVQQQSQLLRIELDIDEQGMPEIAALPWEFMCLPGNANLGEIWIATDPNLVFSRRRAQWHPAPPIQLEQGEKLRIALAIASLQELGEVEHETVQTALQELAKSQPEHIELLPVVNPATPTAIDDLLEQKPHIFHFIGHGRLQNEDGENVGEIALVKKVFNQQKVNWVDASFFGGLFNRHRPGIVFLQACESGMSSASQAFVSVASKIVQQNISVVVAMQYEVSNLTASQFAYEFYERLAKDYPVDIATQNGRRTVALDTQYRKRDFAIPVIFMRVQDGYLFKRQVVNQVSSESSQKGTAFQPGKYNVNIGEGNDIHIGDRIYQQKFTSLASELIATLSNAKFQGNEGEQGGTGSFYQYEIFLENVILENEQNQDHYQEYKLSGNWSSFVYKYVYFFNKVVDTPWGHNSKPYGRFHIVVKSTNEVLDQILVKADRKNDDPNNYAANKVEQFIESKIKEIKRKN
ncbi:MULTISPECIES: CHAT domain-containing protein [unclassified Tolypothrix]|uniref:CHAT domain-containing protein n=1 Tax=unclassified Tolypothrix TaxID=2649714 RepID=UPI000693CF41|nr:MULTISPECIES: CHAT domain-containing protein [unclassified Tolypothrix]MBE9081577.1 CHAT domain-containing protein [Tolypothrix sp. LEGE 11397]UYD23829.1 CHAT domain-containing protein [Tolypothrix sp. PCC 7712]UYD33946.1 CHAT domain-containing protein [Tolypothrix sp. PCC 7601]BAY89548.1 hypothetical protein NIES3275_15510 [Microchaete diplosiphon NIES-3275]